MTAPLILWFRRDLRLDDHPMLSVAVASGRPLIPVMVLDPETAAIGAAARWRLGLGIADFATRLQATGSRLILRRGAALPVLQGLITETGAAGVVWTRAYDPASRARDAGVKAALRAAGHRADSFPGCLLHEPWEVETGSGGFYRVYTPFWRALRDRVVPLPEPSPPQLRPPENWPASDRLEDWGLARGMQRGAEVALPFQSVGEDAARARLADFLAGPIADYAVARDFPGRVGTSRLSAHLALGEIGPRRVWHAGLTALHEGRAGAETFLKELVWREFAWHLMHHTPHIATANWKPDWDAFPWSGDNPWAEAWRRGMTGVPFVDAAMREMYVTGTMHNRGRMIVASYLTKHLMTHWKVGLDWFADCLTDWDAASNAMGWQWAAGSGPDAAPYFRIFNPDTQAERFDPDGSYRRRWIAERSPAPGPEALAYFDAVPRSWALRPDAPYPQPARSLAAGRAAALAAYGAGRA